MRAPDIAYSFVQPKDVSGPTLESTHRTADNSVTSTVVLGGTLQDLPVDRAFVLTNASALALPGAAQGVVQLRIVGTTPALNVFDIFQERFLMTAGKAETAVWQGELIILGGGQGVVQVQWQGNFDAGANANRVIGSFSGYTIPRANIANG